MTTTPKSSRSPARSPSSSPPQQPTVSLAGNPQQTIANYFTDPTNQFFVGKWTSTPGTWRVRYTEA